MPLRPCSACNGRHSVSTAVHGGAQDDKEVTASAVLMRSTLFTWCFIDYWLPAAERGVENRDNGALLLVSHRA